MSGSRLPDDRRVTLLGFLLSNPMPKTTTLSLKSTLTKFEQDAKRRAEILARLNGLASEKDVEKAHADADSLLCEYLAIVGARDIVEAYDAIEKWYA